MQRTKDKSPVSQRGFTIVELMVATLVFSVILLVITMGVLSFTHAYYSGLTSTNTQNTARNIISEISRSIEFSGDIVAGTDDTGSAPKTSGTVISATDTSGTSFFCAGSKIYLFKVGKEFSGTSSSSDPGLYSIPFPGSCPKSGDPLPAIPAANGTQLLGKNMRLTVLSVEHAAQEDTYNINLHIAYGDSDLLCNTSKTSVGGCAKGTGDYPVDNAGSATLVTGDDVACKIQTGFQFCAIAGLTTMVAVRVAGSAS